MKQTKKDIIKSLAINKSDVGSAEIQIGLRLISEAGFSRAYPPFTPLTLLTNLLSFKLTNSFSK